MTDTRTAHGSPRGLQADTGRPEGRPVTDTRAADGSPRGLSDDIGEVRRVLGGENVAKPDRNSRHPTAMEMNVDPNDRPCELAPLEAFRDTLAPPGAWKTMKPWLTDDDLGPNSYTVQAVFASGCSGYREPPTAPELYRAMRRTPSRRDVRVLRAWIIEADEIEWIQAWSEQAYSWRMLARAIKLSKYPCWSRIRSLHLTVKRPDLVPNGAWPVWR